jgi:hypothetical protein
MREVQLRLDYLPIEALVELIDEPSRSVCNSF